MAVKHRIPLSHIWALSAWYVKSASPLLKIKIPDALLSGGPPSEFLNTGLLEMVRGPGSVHRGHGMRDDQGQITLNFTINNKPSVLPSALGVARERYESPIRVIRLSGALTIYLALKI